MTNKIILDSNELYQKYKIEHLSQAKLAKYFHCSVDTIVRNLKDYNIESNTNSDYVAPPIVLTPIQKEVLYGALLGDGSLAKYKDSVNTCLSYGSKSRQHVEFVMRYFKQYVAPSGICCHSVFDTRTNKTYAGFYFRTINNSTFEQEREHWYVNGKKVIPADLELTPLVCLIWYIGDGTLCHSGRSESIRLATNCFSKSEQEQILIPQLLQFDAHLLKKGVGKDGKMQYCITIPRHKVCDFLNYIGPCPFDDYSYKWATREYINKPPQNHTALEETFCELYLKGYSYYQIAKQFHVDPAVVRHYLRKRNIYVLPDENRNAIVVVGKDNGSYLYFFKSMQEAAQQLNFSNSYISMCVNGKKSNPKYQFYKLSQLDSVEQSKVLIWFNIKNELEGGFISEL